MVGLPVPAHLGGPIVTSPVLNAIETLFRDGCIRSAWMRIIRFTRGKTLQVCISRLVSLLSIALNETLHTAEALWNINYADE